MFNYEESIESLVFEPLAQAIYSNVPSEQLVLRNQTWCSPDCDDDVLPLKGARQLRMDSGLAKLCWIEYLKSVKCSTLPNIGDNSELVFKTDRFSEAHVYGIAIEQRSHLLYFLVQEFDKAVLYRTHLKNNSPEEVKILDRMNAISGKLECNFGKCFWIDQNRLVILDVDGKSVSKLAIPDDIKDFALDLQHIPNKPNNVIPDSPNIVELKDDGVLTWDTVDLNNVTYSMKIIINGYSATIDNIESNQFNISDLIKDLDPYSKLDVKLAAQTPWARSRVPLHQAIHLPMSHPSEPRNFLVFWEPLQFQVFSSEDKEMMSYSLTWQKPLRLNGPLLKYELKVFCGIRICLTFDEIDGKLTHLSFNSTLQGVTQLELHALNSQVLHGPPAKFLIGHEQVWPVPTILLADQTGLAVVDLNSMKTLASFPNLLVATPQQNTNFISYSAQDKTILYRNEGENVIRILDVDKMKTHYDPMIELPDEAENLIFDQIGQYFYWFAGKKVFRKQSTWENSTTVKAVIFEADEEIANIVLEAVNNKHMFYSTRSGKLGTFTISNEGKAYMSQNDLIGTKCVLDEGPALAEFTVVNQRIYFIMAKTHKLWSFDIQVF